MRKLAIIVFFFGCFQSNAQTVIGKWKTIDDKTKEVKSVVEIFESNNKVYGKVIEIFDVTKRDRKCEKCEGTDKNKPVLGMQIIRGLKRDGEMYDGGKIIDPETGGVYKCALKLSGKDKLEVRGYMGFALIGRTQTWVRVK